MTRNASVTSIVRRNKTVLIFEFFAVLLLFSFYKYKAIREEQVCYMQKWFDLYLISVINIAVPRSIFEAEPILLKIGCRGYVFIIILYIICLLFGYIFVFKSLVDAFREKSLIETTSIQEIFVNTGILVFGLIFRTPVFSNGPFFNDVIDKSGVFILKEGSFMLYSYYFLSIVLINIAVSIRTIVNKVKK